MLALVLALLPSASAAKSLVRSERRSTRGLHLSGCSATSQSSSSSVCVDFCGSGRDLFVTNSNGSYECSIAGCSASFDCTYHILFDTKRICNACIPSDLELCFHVFDSKVICVYPDAIATDAPYANVTRSDFCSFPTTNWTTGCQLSLSGCQSAHHCNNEQDMAWDCSNLLQSRCSTLDCNKDCGGMPSSNSQAWTPADTGFWCVAEAEKFSCHNPKAIPLSNHVLELTVTCPYIASDVSECECAIQASGTHCQSCRFTSDAYPYLTWDCSNAGLTGETCVGYDETGTCITAGSVSSPDVSAVAAQAPSPAGCPDEETAYQSCLANLDQPRVEGCTLCWSGLLQQAECSLLELRVCEASRVCLDCRRCQTEMLEYTTCVLNQGPCVLDFDCLDNGTSISHMPASTPAIDGTRIPTTAPAPSALSLNDCTSMEASYLKCFQDNLVGSNASVCSNCWNSYLGFSTTCEIMAQRVCSGALECTSCGQCSLDILEYVACVGAASNCLLGDCSRSFGTPSPNQMIAVSPTPTPSAPTTPPSLSPIEIPSPIPSPRPTKAPCSSEKNLIQSCLTEQASDSERVACSSCLMMMDNTTTDCDALEASACTSVKCVACSACRDRVLDYGTCLVEAASCTWSGCSDPTAGPSSQAPMSTLKGFSCLNGTNQCLFTGNGSFPLKDPPSFVTASCDDATGQSVDACSCTVRLGPINGDSDRCERCELLVDNQSDLGWRISFDCSNLMNGSCVGRNSSGGCIVSNSQIVGNDVSISEATMLHRLWLSGAYLVIMMLCL